MKLAYKKMAIKKTKTQQQQNAEKLNKEQHLRLLIMEWREKEDMWELW